MSDDMLEILIDKANDNWQSAMQGNPTDLSGPADKIWGFFSYGDAPPAIGGGTGVFVWFPDRISMLEFIKETLPYSPPGQYGLDWDEVAKNTATIIENMKVGSVTDCDGIRSLNEVLKTFSQIEWLGTFDELMNGDHPYITEVREEFRLRETGKKSNRPIKPEELDALREFLTDWGI